jgi:hypothetical protein
LDGIATDVSEGMDRPDPDTLLVGIELPGRYASAA